MAESRCVADFEGQWSQPDFESGLIDRCRRYWTTPIKDLPDVMLATYINQKFALVPMQKEAQRRIDKGLRDDSELYEGQLHDSLVSSRQQP
jgi:hypothetical protein